VTQDMPPRLSAGQTSVFNASALSCATTAAFGELGGRLDCPATRPPHVNSSATSHNACISRCMPSWTRRSAKTRAEAMLALRRKAACWKSADV
jgi:hypothetical protein